MARTPVAMAAATAPLRIAIFIRPPRTPDISFFHHGTLEGEGRQSCPVFVTGCTDMRCHPNSSLEGNSSGEIDSRIFQQNILEHPRTQRRTAIVTVALKVYAGVRARSARSALRICRVQEYVWTPCGERSSVQDVVCRVRK